MPQAEQKLKVLFLCTGNACRSQMAEGWARQLHGDRLEPLSAGLTATRLDPMAEEVMAEAGVDISQQQSKSIESFLDDAIDFVVTVCNHAHETCPRFPGGAKVVHHGFDDPPSLTWRMSDEEQMLEVYRRVRDEIRDFVRELPQLLESGA
jgi:arsenate reductase